jgi:hypothetical protein
MNERQIFPDRPAPFHRDADSSTVDGGPDLREWIATQIYLSIAQAEMAWRALEIADDHGARYHIRKMAGHNRQIIEGANELKAFYASAPAAEGCEP